ncbi:FG-GAP-like repeat-containing protein [Embleya sp. NPDC127516]|uniref:FG-GAP-like repeat-containing protein n=1 Tax=Embleya sp. NPDC127516 TaxID=3363990 RepID=UPI00382419FA
MILLDEGGGNPRRAAEPAAAPVRVDENAAQRRARESGQPVTVETTLTATGTTVANPDGSFSRTERVLPIRVKNGDGWANVDPTLRRTGAGYATTATTTKLVFAAGGSPAATRPEPRPAPRRPAAAPAAEGALAAGAPADGKPAHDIQSTGGPPRGTSSGVPPADGNTPATPRETGPTPGGPATVPPVVTAWPTGPLGPIPIDPSWDQTPLPDGALVRMTTGEGRTFTVSWPNGPLPTAQTSGNRAVYPNVLPGVDLVLTARDGGFSQVLVVRTRDAAAHPKLAELALQLSAVDLAFKHDESGVTRVVDAAGGEVAASPTPFMWDSAGHAPDSLWSQRQTSFVAGSVPAPPDAPELPGLPALNGPEPGTHEAVVGSSLEGDRLRLTPDRKLLDNPDTVFPVFVDPSFWGHSAAWTLAYKPHPGSSFWMGANYNGGTTNARVGHENTSGGTARSYFRMSFDPSLRGANISAATFRALEVHSWSCSARPVSLYLTGPISSSTTWNNQPGQYDQQQSVNVAKGYSASCPGDWVGFNARNAVDQAKNNGWGDITFKLQADSETDTYGWKKFDVNPSLEVVYWRPPNPPTDISISPGGACRTTEPYPVVGMTDVTINARATDPDGDLRRIWVTVDSSAGGERVLFGYLDVDGQGWIHHRIPMARLQDGATYSFRMQANDWTGADSDPNAVVTCHFRVDKAAPNPPSVTSPQYRAGSDNAWPEGADYGTPGDFTFAANGSNDTTAYAYSFDTNLLDTRVAAPSPGGSVTINHTPAHAGPVQLYVKALDTGGNWSSQTVYTFFVEPRDEVDGPMDFTGDRIPDLAAVDPNGNLRIHPSFSGGRLNQSIDAVKNDDGSGSPGRSQVPAGHFKDALTTYHGDWWGGDGFQDLVARMPDGKLWIYPGNGRGGVDTEGRMELLLPEGAPAPQDLTQILTIGDATGDGLPDMLATTADDLWAFDGYTGASLLTARKVKAGGMGAYTIHGAGDITGDGTFDLLLRQKAGDGKLMLRPGKAPAAGTGTDLARLGDSGDDTAYGAGGWQASAIAWITAIPDVNADGIPDLWVGATDGNRYLYPGGRTVHGPRSNLDGDAWDYCATFPGAAGGTQKLCGPILDKYLALGGPGWALPSTSTTATPVKPGKYVHFRWPGGSIDTASIYWSPETGAHEIHGGIRGEWEARNWENSYLGFPTSDEYDVSNGRRSDLQGGYIRWNKANGFSTAYTYGGETPTTHNTLGGDFNGDGKADIATIVDYVNCAAGLWTHVGNASGGFEAPFESWTNPTGWWCVDSAKYATGDFNADGRDDIGALYRYGDGRVALHTKLGRPDGGFVDGPMSWEQASGFDWDRTTLLAGDANGDHRDELLAVYGYADGRIAYLTFPSRVDGGFDAPVKGFEIVNPGWWWYESARYTAGDFNGDGRTDIGAVYMYDNGDVSAMTALANPNGTFAAPTAGWGAAGAGWNRSAVQLTAGDVNGDGRAEMAMMYGHPVDRMSLYTFTTAPNGLFGAPVMSTDTGPNNWNTNNSAALMGDVNGDGRADMYTIYNYRSTRWTAFTFLGQPTAGFDSGSVGWSVPWGKW